jgi:tetrahydromethanopterin S-methyltransferase subunit C
MNNTLLVTIGLLIVASISVGIATLFSLNVSVVYLVGLIIWLISIEIYYKVKYQITKK